MNHVAIASLAIGLCVASTRDAATIKESAEIFVGSTPCSNVIRPLLGITNEPDCAWNECKCFVVEWNLTLYTNRLTSQPTRYKLLAINRFVVKHTNMYSQPGIKTESEGTWTDLANQTTGTEAVFYQLNTAHPKMSLTLLKLSDNLLHIVDGERNLMIGNEFYSYTLNRATN